MADAPDYNQIYQQSLQQVQQANQPALQSLQSQQAAIPGQFAAQYGQLQAGSFADVGNQQKVTSNEFGARGIPLSSGIFGQTLTDQLGTINRYYQGQGQGILAGSQSALADFASRIAQYNAGINQQAVSNAQNLYGQQLSAYQDALNRAAQIQAAQIQAGPAYAQVGITQQQLDYLKNLSSPTYLAQQSAASLFGPSGKLAGLLGQSAADKYVDKNEYSTALQLLTSTSPGLTAQQAQSILDQTLQNGGYVKYGKY